MSIILPAKPDVVTLHGEDAASFEVADIVGVELTPGNGPEARLILEGYDGPELPTLKLA